MTDYDRFTDFNDYKTFDFYKPGAPNPAEGPLFIDLIDCKTKTLVWQGIATGNLKSTDKSSGEGDRITRFVQEIMGTFPPPHKRSQLAQN